MNRSDVKKLMNQWKELSSDFRFQIQIQIQILLIFNLLQVGYIPLACKLVDITSLGRKNLYSSFDSEIALLIL